MDFNVCFKEIVGATGYDSADKMGTDNPLSNSTSSRNSHSSDLLSPIVLQILSLVNLPRQIPAQHQDAVLLVDWGVVRHIEAKSIPFR